MHSKQHPRRCQRLRGAAGRPRGGGTGPTRENREFTTEKSRLRRSRSAECVETIWRIHKYSHCQSPPWEPWHPMHLRGFCGPSHCSPPLHSNKFRLQRLCISTAVHSSGQGYPINETPTGYEPSPMIGAVFDINIIFHEMEYGCQILCIELGWKVVSKVTIRKTR
jgi:hypothetical protein